MWLKIAKIDLAGRTKKSIGGADSYYILTKVNALDFFKGLI